MNRTITLLIALMLAFGAAAATSDYVIDEETLVGDVNDTTATISTQSMILFNGAGRPYQVMSCGLNSSQSGADMENSTGALIYDVYMQTSLDD